MLTPSRLRSIGWAAMLSVCFVLTMALTFRVNAVKSEVRLTERQIVALRQEKSLLETEFETRANQQQLKALNEVEFGYQAPDAKQYVDGDRELAMLGEPAAPNAPAPIMVASADDAAVPAPVAASVPAMVNPLTGKPDSVRVKPARDVEVAEADALPRHAVARGIGQKIVRLAAVDKPVEKKLVKPVEKHPAKPVAKLAAKGTDKPVDKPVAAHGKTPGKTASAFAKAFDLPQGISGQRISAHDPARRVRLSVGVTSRHQRKAAEE